MAWPTAPLIGQCLGRLERLGAPALLSYVPVTMGTKALGDCSMAVIDNHNSLAN